MPVEILMSSGWIETVGSEATDLGGSFSIVNTNAAPASAKATPNSFNFRMVVLFCEHPPVALAGVGPSATCCRVCSITEPVYNYMPQTGDADVQHFVLRRDLLEK